MEGIDSHAVLERNTVNLRHSEINTKEDRQEKESTSKLLIGIEGNDNSKG